MLHYKIGSLMCFKKCISRERFIPNAHGLYTIRRPRYESLMIILSFHPHESNEHRGYTCISQHDLQEVFIFENELEQI